MFEPMEAEEILENGGTQLRILLQLRCPLGTAIVAELRCTVLTPGGHCYLVHMYLLGLQTLDRPYFDNLLVGILHRSSLCLLNEHIFCIIYTSLS